MDLLCENEDCDKEATVRYRFPWGAEGIVCDDHLFIKQQLATQQLNTTLAVAPLVDVVDSAELRQAKAKLLEQEQTIHDLQTRNGELVAELAASKPPAEH
jgi:hypothetical protein